MFCYLKGIEREEQMGAKFRGHGGPCLEVGERLEKERGEKGILGERHTKKLSWMVEMRLR